MRLIVEIFVMSQGMFILITFIIIIIAEAIKIYITIQIIMTFIALKKTLITIASIQTYPVITEL
jgi:hypothetical protein